MTPPRAAGRSRLNGRSGGRRSSRHGPDLRAEGYAATSLQDIADAVGSSREHLLLHQEQGGPALRAGAAGAGRPAAGARESAAVAAAPAQVRLREFILRWMALRRSQRLWSQVAEREFTRLRGRGCASSSPSGTVQRLRQADRRAGHRRGDLRSHAQPSIVTSCVFELMNHLGQLVPAVRGAFLRRARRVVRHVRRQRPRPSRGGSMTATIVVPTALRRYELREVPLPTSVRTTRCWR